MLKVQAIEEPDSNNKDERDGLQTEGSVPPLHRLDSQAGRAAACLVFLHQTSKSQIFKSRDNADAR